MHFVVHVLDGASASATADEGAAINAFNEKIIAGGHWVYAAGLAHPADSTVIDNRDVGKLITSGPAREADEWVAGLWIIDAPDLDTAVELMIEGSRACNRRLEVRPVLGPTD